MKKKTSAYVYIALLFLIFLVAVFPYKEGFDFNTMFDKDMLDLNKPTSNKDISGSDTNYFNTDISGSNIPYLPYSF